MYTQTAINDRPKCRPGTLFGRPETRRSEWSPECDSCSELFMHIRWTLVCRTSSKHHAPCHSVYIIRQRASHQSSHPVVLAGNTCAMSEVRRTSMPRLSGKRHVNSVNIGCYSLSFNGVFHECVIFWYLNVEDVVWKYDRSETIATLGYVSIQNPNTNTRIECSQFHSVYSPRCLAVTGDGSWSVRQIQPADGFRVHYNNIFYLLT